jgi:hypothetical protein
MTQAAKICPADSDIGDAVALIRAHVSDVTGLTGRALNRHCVGVAVGDDGFLYVDAESGVCPMPTLGMALAAQL